MSAIKSLMRSITGSNFRIYNDDDGKIYYKGAWWRPRRQISKEEMKSILHNSKVTRISETVQGKEGLDMFSRLLKQIKTHQENQTSDYGERVIMIPVKIVENRNGNFIDVDAHWQAATESGTYIQDVWFKVKEFTSPMVKKGLSPAKLYECLMQCAMSGKFATEEDEKRLEEAFGLGDDDGAAVL